MTDLPAGRELDALIEEKVMGHEVEPRWYDAHGGPLPDPEDASIKPHEYYVLPPRTGARYSTREVPYYSRDIDAAWEVLERFATRHLNLGLQGPGMWGPEGWYVTLGTGHIATAFAFTAPLAICLAALKAVEGPN